MTRRRAWLALPLLGWGCAQRPRGASTALDSIPPFNPPTSSGRLWRADPAASVLRIVAFRGGAAARLGHHHILQATRFQASLWLPDQGLAGAQGELRVRLDELEMDRPEWRAQAGGEFNEKPLDADAIAATRRNLQRALNAEVHPEVSLHLRQLGGATPWWTAELDLRLNGQAQVYRLPLAVELTNSRLRLQGRFLLRHSDHGLQAFSLLGGLLAVQDAVVLEWDLVLVH